MNNGSCVQLGHTSIARCCDMKEQVN